MIILFQREAVFYRTVFGLKRRTRFFFYVYDVMQIEVIFLNSDNRCCLICIPPHSSGIIYRYRECHIIFERSLLLFFSHTLSTHCDICIIAHNPFLRNACLTFLFALFFPIYLVPISASSAHNINITLEAVLSFGFPLPSLPSKNFSNNNSRQK